MWWLNDKKEVSDTDGRDFQNAGTGYQSEGDLVEGK
jgi:hypothetical protein